MPNTVIVETPAHVHDFLARRAEASGATVEATAAELLRFAAEDEMDDVGNDVILDRFLERIRPHMSEEEFAEQRQALLGPHPPEDDVSPTAREFMADQLPFARALMTDTEFGKLEAALRCGGLLD